VPDNPATPAARVPAARVPAAQQVWLVLYWFALAVNVALLLVGLASRETTFASLVALVLAAVSTLIGVIFAIRIARAHVTTTVFVKATTTVRVIALAWVLLSLAIVSGAVVAVFAGLPREDVDWSAGFAGTVGAISILAALGPAYSEYREAMTTAGKYTA
jgi:hypothetical protein